MAQIDFYVVSGNGDPARQRFACRLAEKAYRLKNRVHINVADPATAQTMDQLLWTFRDGSFVPHDVIDSGATQPCAPVTIGVGSPDQDKPDLLINLTESIPEDAGSFARIAEIVTSDEECKTRSRKHFAAYRDAGHTMDTHKL